MSNNKVEAVIFDCDGTLSAIEGITELASLNGKAEVIRELTEKAMGQTGLSLELYQQRLDIVQPTQKQCQQVATSYINNVTPNTKEVISQLQANDIAVYVMSAGVDACVIPFAEYLGVEKENVFSVPINFDNDGNFQGFDLNCPLTSNDGKLMLAKKLKQQHGSIIAVGDGMNDISMKPELKMFIGFGGAFYRESIKKLSDAYISDNDMSEVIKYCL